MMPKGGTISAARHSGVTSRQVSYTRDNANDWMANDFSGACPVRDVLDRVGDKWSVLVVLRLGRRKERFRSLLRSVAGISQRMLTVTLRGLERDGLVSRQVFDTRPPSVEYSLTPLGDILLDHIGALAAWAVENQSAIRTARSDFDAEAG